MKKKPLSVLPYCKGKGKETHPYTSFLIPFKTRGNSTEVAIKNFEIITHFKSPHCMKVLKHFKCSFDDPLSRSFQNFFFNGLKFLTLKTHKKILMSRKRKIGQSKMYHDYTLSFIHSRKVKMSILHYTGCFFGSFT